MEEHFAGRYEVEVKFRMTSPAALLQRLIDCNAERFVIENYEHDTYFEMANNQLNQQQISMVLRQMRPAGINLWIIKGPGIDRCEAVRLESYEKAQSMLQTLGYRTAFELIKTRSIYFLEQFHITVDHITSLGNFAEISVMTDDQKQLETLKTMCLNCAQFLGLPLDKIEPRSYRQLLGH
jgi:adenylate cyclase class 2